MVCFFDFTFTRVDGVDKGASELCVLFDELVELKVDGLISKDVELDIGGEESEERGERCTGREECNEREEREDGLRLVGRLVALESDACI